MAAANELLDERDVVLIEQYLDFLRGQQLRRTAIWNASGSLRRWARYIARKKKRVTTATAADLWQFVRSFGASLRTKKRKSVRKEVMKCIRRVDRFYDFLLAEGHILNRPRGVDLRLKKALDPRDRTRFLGAADVRTKLGLRDRAIMELMAACALTTLEIIRLDLEDLSEGLATVTTRYRKVAVPLHVRKILRRYLDEVRLLYLRDSKERGLFITLRFGRRVSYANISNIKRRLIALSGVKAKSILGRIGK